MIPQSRLVLRTPGFAERAELFVQASLLRLADVHVVDELAQLYGVADPDTLLGFAFAVQAPSSGHVGVELGKLRDRIEANAALGSEDDSALVKALPWPSDGEQWQRSVESSVLAGAPDAMRAFVIHGGMVISRRYFRYQERLRDALRSRAESSSVGIGAVGIDVALLQRGLSLLFPPGPEAEPGTDLQRLGAMVAVLRPVTVLSGGPGTGKTFTIKKVLTLLRAQWRRAGRAAPRVALAAPTGKAAVRMMQAIREGLDKLPSDAEHDAGAADWLRGLPATTIHRLLGWNPYDSTRFRHGVGNPLPYDVVVIDEASMIDLPVMCKLVEAVGTDARLILLGDKNQLASVDVGCVLADLTKEAGPAGLHFSRGFAARMREVEPAIDTTALESETATPMSDGIVHFRRPYRFDARSGLGRVAHAIAEGTEASLGDAVAWMQGGRANGEGPFEDIALVPHAAAGGLPVIVVARIVQGYSRYLSVLREGLRCGSNDEAFYAKVLAELDSFRVLTAHRKGSLGVTGLNQAVGDALVAAGHGPLGKRGQSADRGDWTGRPVLITQNSYETGRMNGDVGVVVPGPNRRKWVVFPSAESGTIERLEFERLPPHETVFAMTIHKSQGSQFRDPVVVLPRRASALLTRELIYTALTRASKEVAVVGDGPLLLDALKRPVERASTLNIMFQEDAACRARP